MIKTNKYIIDIIAFFAIVTIVILINIIYELQFGTKEIIMISITYSTTIYSIFAVVFKFSYYHQCDPVFDEYAEIKNHATRIGMMLVMVVMSFLLSKDLFNF